MPSFKYQEQVQSEGNGAKTNGEGRTAAGGQGVSSHELGHFWSSINWKEVMARHIVAPRMFMRSGLIRKDLLPKFAGEGDHPETKVVNNAKEFRELFLGKEGTGKRFVIKYSDSSNAYGMNFVECDSEQGGMEAGIDKVVEDMMADNDKRVVQEYIEPLLIRDWVDGKRLVEGKEEEDGGGMHKFHIRALLLVVGDMDVYLYDECRVLIAPEPYICGLVVEGNAVGTKDSRGAAGQGGGGGAVEDGIDKALHAHVTNQSFNKLHKSYTERRHNIALHQCEELGKGDECNGIFKERGVWQQIRSISTRLFKNLAKEKRKFMTLVNTWELFGLDFLVDGEGKVWLLEANPEPSMGMYRKQRVDIEGKEPLESIPDKYVSVYSRHKDEAMSKMKEMAAEYRREKLEKEAKENVGSGNGNCEGGKGIEEVD